MIVIDGKPEPQLRARARRHGNSIRLYDPKKTADYKKYVKASAQAQWTQEPFTGPLEVDIRIYRQIPKSTSKKRRQAKNDGLIRPIVKPDIDNYTKMILDGLNGITWQDDSQVVMLSANKYYSDDPRVEIEIRELDHNV